MSANALVLPSVEQRALQAMNFDQVKADAGALVAESARITEITNPAAYAECHSARMRLKNARVAIEKAGKGAREDANAFQKQVIAKERELVAILEPEEKRLQELQEAEDLRKAAEKRAKEEAERQRIADINARFDALKDLPRQTLSMDVDGIQRLILEAENFSAESFPEEYRAAARFEKTKIIGQLEEALEIRHRMIEEEKRIAAERAELEQLRKEREEREAADRAAREKQEAAERREREAQERARAEAERAAREAREREEANARQAEQERLQREREELAAERQRQEEERARLERERAAAALKAEEDAINRSSLLEAAIEAHQLLVQLGHGRKMPARKLAAAIAREQREAA